MTLARIRARGQLTIPDDIRRAARVAEGDYLEMTVVGDAIVLRPKIAVPKAQAWFWQPAWQAGEQEATEDIRAGRVTHLESSETLLESLD